MAKELAIAKPFPPKRISEAQRDELVRIAERNHGHLLAEDVVKAARRETSPLHSRFTWDDGEAAEKYRYWQARFLISVSVDLIPTKNGNRQIKTFVSFKSTRFQQGGYRIMADVLSDKHLRAQLLRESIEEMQYFRNRYSKLEELRTVFEAMDVAQRTLPKAVTKEKPP